MSGHASQIREHMEVVGSDGQHVGTVDKVDGDRIKLTKRDDPDHSGQHHHFIPVSSIASIQGNQVRLNMLADRAKGLATMSGGSQPSPGMAGTSG
jgi:hypothetical protein